MTTAVQPLAPTPLTLDRLVELTARTAEEVRRGLHAVRFDTRHRWSVRLSSDAYADLWLISWTQDQATALHDHAGSLGALTVVQGDLTEHHWTGRLARRDLPSGTSAAFPLGHVHDVVNRAPAPAVSVHAYSPPLTAMSYYRVDAGGALRRTHSTLTDDPEPAAPTVAAVPLLREEA
ncbi:cysteine dioxygenase family protein [Streptomonospora sp. S1-112]|uniref:Cysteine dioxygenase family protein n=1 Tax=Streptomonospora mangrovi TaxID=2883123 RepID=A0A9X3P0S5_9ACTN|nr:cysteine dioxygenase family protein [Streptomonospora mangrovi]MDA0567786.1 cysteine dioxygenase family protein [Streptomonospora mangrovi]